MLEQPSPSPGDNQPDPSRQPDPSKSPQVPAGTVSPQSQVTYLNPSPERVTYFQHALGEKLHSLIPHESELRERLRTPEIRRALEAQKSVVIMPVTSRELEDPQVLITIAKVHRDLITRSDGKLHFKIVYNDYRSQDSASAETTLQRFKTFFEQQYASWEVPGVYNVGRKIKVSDCVSYEVLNDSHVQESLVALARSSGGENRASPGKGNAIALGAYHAIRAGYQNIVLHDSDVLTFDKTPIVEALLLPLLDGSCEMTKLSFVRYAHGVMNGRLTRGFSLPILQALYEHAKARMDLGVTIGDPELADRNLKLLRNLAGFRYPFSGEIGFKTEFLKGCAIHPTYGLESGFINDAAAKLAVGTTGRIGDVMVSQYDHFHSPIGTLGDAPTGLHAMLEQTYEGLLVPLMKRGVVAREDMGSTADAQSIIGRGYHIWRESIESDKIAVKKVIQQVEAISSFCSVTAKNTVFQILEINAHDHVESASLTDEEKKRRLASLVNSGVPSEMVYGSRLLNQLDRELRNNTFFKHLEQLVRTGKFMDRFVERPKFGNEIQNWQIDPEKLNQGVAPLYRDPKASAG